MYRREYPGLGGFRTEQVSDHPSCNETRLVRPCDKPGTPAHGNRKRNEQVGLKFGGIVRHRQ